MTLKKNPRVSQSSLFNFYFGWTSLFIVMHITTYMVHHHTQLCVNPLRNLMWGPLSIKFGAHQIIHLGPTSLMLLKWTFFLFLKSYGGVSFEWVSAPPDLVTVRGPVYDLRCTMVGPTSPRFSGVHLKICVYVCMYIYICVWVAGWVGGGLGGGTFF